MVAKTSLFSTSVLCFGSFEKIFSLVSWLLRTYKEQMSSFFSFFLPLLFPLFLPRSSLRPKYVVIEELFELLLK